MKIGLICFLYFFSFTGLFSQTNQNLAKTPALNYDWRPGFVSITELTGAVGLGLVNDGLSKYYYGLTTVAGYQFTRNLKVGGGVGLHRHEEATLFPLYLDIRYSLNAQELVPFFAGAGGLMIYFKEIGDPRVFINPALGLRYVAANKTAVSFSTGLMVTTGGAAERKSYINFKLGIELKGK